MQNLTPNGQNLVNRICSKYNLSYNAVVHMLIAVNNGGGTMAQFNSPELGGSGQWMRGGMTMVGDMFNHGLKMTVDNLCNELSNALANTQIFEVVMGPYGANWYPSELGVPSSSGAQNNIRYAVFPQTRRLAIDFNGAVTIYDTLDHNIGGVSQQQGGDTSLTFSSQYGTIPVNSLPKISGPGIGYQQVNFVSPAPVNQNYDQNVNQNQNQNNNTHESNPNRENTVELLEKLGKLYEAGVLTEAEFIAKKTDLLNRL